MACAVGRCEVAGKVEIPPAGPEIVLSCGFVAATSSVRGPADIPQCMSGPLPAGLLSVTESGQQKGAGR
jgi:hypothetical protein